MTLFIPDAEVDALAEEVRKLTKSKTKTEAVRRALKAQLAKARRSARAARGSPCARQGARRRDMGPSDPGFGMKAYTDEMWGDA
jgi:antitoxin VapB